MLPQTSYDDASLALARLLNQDSIPSSEAARVQFFIASGVQRILRALDFPQQITYASLTTDANGRVALGALQLGMTPGFDIVTDGNNKYTLTIPSGKYAYTAGSYRYNVVVEAGQWILYTSEKNASITLGYYATPDAITLSSALPSIKVGLQPMVIAKAALIYYRAAQDPEADTEQEEDSFRQEIAEISEAQERRRPQRFAQSPYDRVGHSIGATGGRHGTHYGGRS